MSRLHVKLAHVNHSEDYPESVLTYAALTGVESMVRAWYDQPAACTIDVGVTRDGRTLLIECNDGFVFGNCGLAEITYARMLEARRGQLPDVTSHCRLMRHQGGPLGRRRETRDRAIGTQSVPSSDPLGSF